MPMTDKINEMLSGSGRKPGGMNAIEPPATNSLLQPQGGMGGTDLQKLLEKLRRQTAFRGFDVNALLQALLGIEDGGGTDPGGIGGGSVGVGVGSGGCLHGDTLVRMADGTDKPASQIVVEDLILGHDPDIGNVPQSVMTTSSSRQPCRMVVFDDGSEIIASTTHQWYSKGEIMATLYLSVGMELGSKTIMAIDDAGTHIVYWWSCAPNHNYYAGGVLHHNARAEGKNPVNLFPPVNIPKVKDTGGSGSGGGSG